MKMQLKIGFVLALFIMCGNCGVFAQKQQEQASQDTPPINPDKTKTAPKVTTKQSVVVSATLTPDELEEDKINALYDAAEKLERNGDCKAAVEKYEREVIPRADRSRLNEARNKFLFRATQGIASCLLKMERPVEAEQKYVKSLDYLPVWPGKEDSAYPETYEMIGGAQAKQSRWKEAEESLRKSVQVFDELIARAVNSDSEFWRTEHANNLRQSEDLALANLAGVILNEGKTEEGLALLEKAYAQASEFHASTFTLQNIVQFGENVATIMRDSEAQAKWKKRMPPAMMR